MFDKDTLDDSIERMDTIDFFSAMVAMLGAAAVAGLISLVVNVGAGYDFSSVAFTVGSSTEFSWGLTGIIAGLVAAVYTNRMDAINDPDTSILEDASQGEKVAVAVVVVGAAVFTLSPDLASYVTNNTWAQIVYTGLHGVAILVIASEN